ncbi:MAG: hypothetical protein FWF46_07595 [Oscillospiraceae bacterium]|nr:hypothetical protein [Oscillospiraceae bacterium]
MEKIKEWIKIHKILSIIIVMLIIGIIGVPISIITADQRMSKIEEAIKTGDYATAKTMLDDELSVNLTQSKPYLLYADYYIALKEYSNAVDILGKGLEKIPYNTIPDNYTPVKSKLAEIKDRYSTEIETEIKQKEADKIAREQELAKQEEEANKNRSEQEKQERTNFIASSKTVDWKELVRNPEQYKNQPIKVVGEIAQVMSGGWFTKGVRLYEDYDIKGSTWLQKEWYIAIDVEKNTPKILKNDIVIFYGTYTGTTEITRAITKTKDTVPTLDVKYYEIK